MFNETRAILDVAFENPIEVKSYGKQPPHTVVQLSKNHLKAVALIFLLEIRFVLKESCQYELA